MPSEKHVFTRASILFRPRALPALAAGREFGGGAGYCPRVRYAYFTWPFSAIVGCPTG